LVPIQSVAQAMPHYTQGMMDLGATLCTPKNPKCLQCPVKENCKAFQEGKPENYPVKTKKIKRTSEQLWLLYAQTKNGDVWMVQRPQSGIWAGLYCLPVFENYEALQAFVKTKSKLDLQDMSVVKHVLTHKDLYLHPVALHLNSPKSLGQGRWFDQPSIPNLGLPAPIRKLVG
jgi:A/G-specific adenine glycosylase